MAKLYANENFRRKVVEALRELGHDVLTSFEAGNANLSIPDDAVLDFARANDRIVLTFNRQDFIRLHFQNPIHPGIIVCTDDRDNAALTIRIHESIENFKGNTANQLIRVNRPN
jgi:predicted nuclease of predicted toxin-antitoxin system